MNIPDWNLIRAFAATADAGSMSKAARNLGLTQPTLTRQVAALEVALGVLLFDRVGKRLRLTDTGRALLEHARAMFAAADTMALAAAGKSDEIAGRVTISATHVVASYLLPDIIARLRLEAPHITVSVVATDTISDLRRREADIAIRHVRPSDPDLIGQWICERPAHFYASKRWLDHHGAPANVSDLPVSDLMAFEPLDDFVEHLSAMGKRSAPDEFRITSENGVVLWQMARRGLGVAIMLDEVAAATPDVRRVLPDLPAIAVPFWLVSHRELHTSRRVRVVFDRIANDLRALATRQRAHEEENAPPRSPSKTRPPRPPRRASP